DLARTRGLDVQHPRDARIDSTDVHRPRGLQRHLVAGIAEPPEQLRASLLCQRLTAGHAYMAYAVPRDLGEDHVVVPPFAAVEGVGGVAILAAKRTAGQAHEDRRPANAARLALQGQEDLGQSQALGGGRARRVVNGVHRAILPPGAEDQFWRPSRRAPSRSAAMRAASVPG